MDNDVKKMSRTPIYAHHRKSRNSAPCYLDLRYCFYAHDYTLSNLNLLASTTVLQFPQKNVQILHCCRSYDVVWLLPAQNTQIPQRFDPCSSTSCAALLACSRAAFQRAALTIAQAQARLLLNTSVPNKANECSLSPS